jgi:probable LLM family oxidoreductase
MQLGVYTFGDLSPEQKSAGGKGAHQRMQELLEEIKLADEVGLDVFAIGEHHRPDYVVSAPAVVLGAAAAITKKIKLSSAVTVLSSDDPVRVYQQYSTIDLISGGRAEIMAGRGSFIESFPLFGYNLKDYDALFAEKIELLIKLNEGEKITWEGKLRPSIDNLGIYPRPLREKLPIWIAIGGTPESVARAGMLGIPMALAIIGGMPDRFAPLVQYYRDNATHAGHDPKALQVGINSFTWIAETSQRATKEFYPGYADVMTRLGRERGWAPMTYEHYETMRSKTGSLLVGSPQEVIDKILYEHELFKHTRYMAQMGVGSVDHKQTLKAIELYGNVVAPAVRKALAS